MVLNDFDKLQSWGHYFIYNNYEIVIKHMFNAITKPNIKEFYKNIKLKKKYQIMKGRHGN